MHGELLPGQSLTLRGVGKEYEMSMTPVREAMRRLVAEGALSLSSSGRITTPELSNERIEELAAIRALLEPELASRALPRAHMALIERLEAINGQIDQVIARSDAVGYRYRARFELTKGGSAPSNRVAAFRGVVRFQVPGAIFVVTGHLPGVEIMAIYFCGDFSCGKNKKRRRCAWAHIGEGPFAKPGQ